MLRLFLLLFSFSLFAQNKTFYVLEANTMEPVISVPFEINDASYHTDEKGILRVPATKQDATLTSSSDYYGKFEKVLSKIKGDTILLKSKSYMMDEMLINKGVLTRLEPHKKRGRGGAFALLDDNDLYCKVEFDEKYTHRLLKKIIFIGDNNFQILSKKKGEKLNIKGDFDLYFKINLMSLDEKVLYTSQPIKIKKRKKEKYTIELEEAFFIPKEAFFIHFVFLGAMDKKVPNIDLHNVYLDIETTNKTIDDYKTDIYERVGAQKILYNTDKGLQINIGFEIE